MNAAAGPPGGGGASRHEGCPGGPVHSRHLTFRNGMTIREIIVDVDDRTFRHAWSARGEPFTHHNASIQVFEEGDGSCWLVWIADFLPNELSGPLAEMIQQGLDTMKATLEA